MLIHLLVELGRAMKLEEIVVTPEQLCAAAEYISLAPELFPDPNLREGLLPILVSKVEDEPAYRRAWARLDRPDNRDGGNTVWAILSAPLSSTTGAAFCNVAPLSTTSSPSILLLPGFVLSGRVGPLPICVTRPISDLLSLRLALLSSEASAIQIASVTAQLTTSPNGLLTEQTLSVY